MAEDRYVSFSERYMAGEDPEQLIVEADHRIEQHSAYIEEIGERLSLGDIQFVAERKRWEAERDILRALLREVEWRCEIASISATQGDVFVNTTLVAACPLCYNTQTEGHKSDCRLHAELKRAVAERDEARALAHEMRLLHIAETDKIAAERDTLRALLREWREAHDVTQDLMLRTDAALEGRDE